MTKRMKIMIIALIVVFGGIIGFNLFKGYMIKSFFAGYEPPAVAVSSVEAVKKQWEPRVNAVGNFVAVNGVEVNSQASGNVTSIHFNSGEYVAQNAPLIDIDDSVEQATLKFNQAKLTLKELDYKRQADLFKRGATPSSNVDEAKANLQQAQADVEKIQAEINQKHIRAPFAGRMGIRQVNLGEYITPGQSKIVSLQSLDPLYLQFYLPEQYLRRLYIGQALLFSVEEYNNYLFNGKITALNARVDISTHNIQVQATVANCPAQFLQDPKQKSLVSMQKLKDSEQIVVNCNSQTNLKANIQDFTFIPGMFASIQVEQPSIPDVIVLPSTAISYSLYGNSVFIIGKDKDGKTDDKGEPILRVNRVYVETGEQQGNYTIITKGVKAGDIVVSSGELKLQNGARVVINNSVILKDYANPDELGQ